MNLGYSSLVSVRNDPEEKAKLLERIKRIKVGHIIKLGMTWDFTSRAILANLVIRRKTRDLAER